MEEVRLFFCRLKLVESRDTLHAILSLKLRGGICMRRDCLSWHLVFAKSPIVVTCIKTTMKSNAKLNFWFSMSVLFLCVATQLRAPVVHTKLGSLKGEYVSVKGKETGVHAYLGVPFAKPPLGPSLRLAPPQPAERWEGVRYATKQPPMCIQPERFALALLDKLGFLLADIPDISEDCLYLNIYTPANRADDAQLPVMVWIHGGGLTVGSASTYDGSALAAYQDVVVVLIQYRLGLLGFLSTGDEHISGNFGLLDQVEALRWIQQHIHIFGGDPGLVTIFGESAGGVSVSLLLLSPLSEGLFHHAIAESGTAAMDLLVENYPLLKAQEVSNASGCSLKSTKTFADCIRSLDIDTIVDFTKDRRLRCPVNVDGHFLTKPVDELFRKHELLTVPFMMGVNNDEAGWMLKNPKDAFIKNLIIDEYIGNGADRVKNRDGFSEVTADIIFNIPVIKTANAHREAGAPVYLYEYQHSLKMVQKRRPSFVGSDHTDEIFTVMGFCFTTTHVKLPHPCFVEEEQLSRTMMSYWGNFARTGSPNGHDLVHWPKYEADEKYLAIGLTTQVTAQHLKKERFVFLTQTVPEKLKRHEENAKRSEL
ncbi:cocaine esterase isoform X3 [Haplochromis burtoni]|uniref:cocaine esterase isoform X3 n=1 Tax=Haplochromis burtoni TaxID=8153 RepID=UPI001C2D64E5|nr:cocaine esterase isoform X3 [Haplochromis burtoni]